MLLYPLKFTPLLKNRIWGGTNICSLKKLPKSSTTIGESWEISDRENENSIVSNGYLKGKSLQELKAQFKDKLLGTTISATKPFPLLIKILDAKEDLSLQVHPPKAVLPQLPAGANSKDEFWYILASNGGEVMLGLNKNANTQEFIDNLSSNHVKDYLNTIKTKPHMLFNIQSGTLHAIGKNNLILEIQENSDTTYRVSDWNRLESNQPRELHLKESLLAINFAAKGDKPLTITFNNNYEILHNHFCEVFNYYITHELQLFTSKKVCEVLSVTSGSVAITCNKESFTLNMGESCFIPANINYKVTPLNIASILITIPKPNLH